MVQAGGELGVACEPCPRLIDDDDIESRQSVLLLPERFSNDSFYTVACRGLAAMFLGDSETESRRITRAAAAQHGKEFIATACRSPEYAAEIGCIQQAIFFAESMGAATDYGVRRARPLARRRFRTRRPALVAMRARKPCVRARLILLG